MTKRTVLNQRLVALFALGVLLFSYPLIALFDRQVFVLGVPILYAFLFAAWAFLIVLMALVMEWRR